MMVLWFSLPLQRDFTLFIYDVWEISCAMDLHIVRAQFEEYLDNNTTTAYSIQVHINTLEMIVATDVERRRRGCGISCSAPNVPDSARQRWSQSASYLLNGEHPRWAKMCYIRVVPWNHDCLSHFKRLRMSLNVSREKMKE